MVTFDAKTFAAVTGKGGSPIDALGTSYGVPSCLMELGKEALSLIPTEFLSDIRKNLADALDIASVVITKIENDLRMDAGITTYVGDTGNYTQVSNSSKFGVDAEEGSIINNFQDWVSWGSMLYGQGASIKECMDTFLELKKYSNGSSAHSAALLTEAEATELRIEKYATAIEQSKDSINFQISATDVIGAIDSTLLERVIDPSLEPSNLVASSITSPVGSVEKIFRLEAGPPIARKGKFVLSVDGLYFDSQSEGLEPALLELSLRKASVTNSNAWKLEYDPSLGGKGIPTTVGDLDGYFNTILDPNITDDSSYLETYYSEDVTLQDLIGQKNRRLYDLSGELQGFITSEASQALISNSRQVMISDNSQFLLQINKRKKQIELAVKLPNIYGKGQIYAPGSVPVNDFSYLEGINFLFDVENQRKVTLKQADVDSCVLPLETKFTQQIDSDGNTTLNHLLVGNIGKASIIDNADASSAASISLNEPIAVNGLFALYNLLSAKTSETNGTDYLIFNGAMTGKSNNAQLVGDTSSIFTLGLGVPYLKGTAHPSNSSLSSVSSMGSYIKLPPQKDFQDLLYTREGATFESWVHIPAFSSYDLGADASGLYRLLLANENTGLKPLATAQSDILNLSFDNNLTTTNGLVFGFTRDRRFTQKDLPSNLPDSNLYNDSVLVLAPTLSYDVSSVGFINSREVDVCTSTSSWLGMTAPVSSTINGVSLSSCEEEFCHIVLTLDPLNNSIKYYLDGVSIATSSYEGVFGISPVKKTPKIPSVFQENSFRYNSTYVSESSVAAAKVGPDLDDFFTPWIIGGGYTDGNPDGNFMGGEYGGKVSGLKGHVGSVKLYSRPLTDAEVLINYTASKNFFKNIAVSGI